MGPEGHLLFTDGYMDGNFGGVDYLKRMIGHRINASGADIFVSGSMFWVRLKALRPLIDADLLESEFEAEKGKLNGTLAHAMKRIFGICAEAAGFRIASTALICNGIDPTEEPYRYARKS